MGPLRVLYSCRTLDLDVEVDVLHQIWAAKPKFIKKSKKVENTKIGILMFYTL